MKYLGLQQDLVFIFFSLYFVKKKKTNNLICDNSWAPDCIEHIHVYMLTHHTHACMHTHTNAHTHTHIWQATEMGNLKHSFCLVHSEIFMRDAYCRRLYVCPQVAQACLLCLRSSAVLKKELIFWVKFYQIIRAFCTKALPF